MMLFSAYAYFTSPEVKEGFVHLGFPSWFRVELGIAKFIGAIMLLVPAVKGRVKEWAYAGFGITVISAFIAHFVSGDGPGHWIPALVALVILAVSNISYHRIQGK
jgi:VIT1/CCC1 family predicted Fe2+/Mn2+ transporter